MRTDSADVWTDVHEERHALFEFLESLTPEQWNAPSLCTAWRVRDVVGHMVSETRMTLASVTWGAVTSGWRINRFIADDGRRRGATPIAELLEDFRSVGMSRSHLPGLSSLSMLVDVVVHQLDIRGPLNEHRRIPSNRMIPVASDLWSNRFFPAPKLFHGFRVTATDADWSAGEGIGVAGPIEALILTMAGRFTALDQLHGEGVTPLRVRAKVA